MSSGEWTSAIVAASSGTPCEGTREVVGAVVVAIVDADQPDRLAALLDRGGLVDQHPDPEALEVGDLLDEVVVAEDAEAAERAAELGREHRHLRRDLLVGAEGAVAEVTGDQQVVAEPSHLLCDRPARSPRARFRDVHVEVGEMETRTSSKARGSEGITEPPLGDLGREHVPDRRSP